MHINIYFFKYKFFIFEKSVENPEMQMESPWDQQ